MECRILAPTWNEQSSVSHMHHHCAVCTDQPVPCLLPCGELDMQCKTSLSLRTRTHPTCDVGSCCSGHMGASQSPTDILANLLQTLLLTVATDRFSRGQRLLVWGVPANDSAAQTVQYWFSWVAQRSELMQHSIQYAKLQLTGSANKNFIHRAIFLNRNHVVSRSLSSCTIHVVFVYGTSFISCIPFPRRAIQLFFFCFISSGSSDAKSSVVRDTIR